MRVLIYLAAAALPAGCDDLTTKPDSPAPSDPPVPPVEVAGLWTASGAPGALLRFSARELGETGPQPSPAGLPPNQVTGHVERAQSLSR